VSFVSYSVQIFIYKYVIYILKAKEEGDERERGTFINLVTEVAGDRGANIKGRVITSAENVDPIYAGPLPATPTSLETLFLYPLHSD